MREIFDEVSARCSRDATRSYSTSFSTASLLLGRKVREGIYGVYGFVRVADEIVDTFHGGDQEVMLDEFRRETRRAIDRGLSLNPILHSFQAFVRQYGIEWELIEAFFRSMEADLRVRRHDETSYREYVYGSAEAVGLMCLRVFADGDDAYYRRHVAPARALGAAFQKVNFLRDLKHDYEELGRSYFPGVDPDHFSARQKEEIERDIEEDFRTALGGIPSLPASARVGVYLAYVYYHTLFRKLRRLPPDRLRAQRVRVPDSEKLLLLVSSYCRCRLGVV